MDPLAYGLAAELGGLGYSLPEAPTPRENGAD
jgi:hypothetical protein